MMKKTLLLLPLFALCTFAVKAQSGLGIESYSFLPAAGYDQLGKTDVYFNWDIGATLVGKLSGGGVELMTLPFWGSSAEGASTDVESFLSPNLATLTVYPNPANVTVEVSWDVASAMVHSSLELYSMLGQRVQTYEVVHENRQLIDVHALPEGMYLLRLVAHDGGTPVAQAKLVVRH